MKCPLGKRVGKARRCGEHRRAETSRGNGAEDEDTRSDIEGDCGEAEVLNRTSWRATNTRIAAPEVRWAEMEASSEPIELQIECVNRVRPYACMASPLNRLQRRLVDTPVAGFRQW